MCKTISDIQEKREAVIFTTEWHIYCMTCGRVIDKMNNGAFAEAIAIKHVKETGHRVILGTVAYIQK